MKANAIVKACRVEPGTRAGLSRRDPRDDLGLDKEKARARLAETITDLGELHARLWAEEQRSILLVLQGMDASGKDGTIRSVFTGLNPQGCSVISFKAPSANDLSHDYLWRVHNALPPRGQIGIFNRSHYEEVLVVRVHELVPKARWKKRYQHIAEFERMLVDEGTTIVKCMLHLSRDEQLDRFKDRIVDPTKAWKFRRGDLDDRARWDAFQQAYEDAINATSTQWAPWHVVPADRNWVRNLAVAEILVETLRSMKPKLPDPPADLPTVAELEQLAAGKPTPSITVSSRKQAK